MATAVMDGPVDGILTLGPGGAKPALDAVRASGLESRVKLATFDLSPEVLTAVRDGDMLFAVDQQPYLQGFLPVMLLAERARYQVFPGRGELIPTGPAVRDRGERGRRDPAQRRGGPLIGAVVARVRRCRSFGLELELEPAAAAADVDRVVLERALVDHGRELLPLAERADAAGDVARRALGVGDRRHLRLLGADGRRERLQVELALDRDDRDDELAVDLRDERLEHGRRVEAQPLGRLEPVRLVLRVVLVRVHGERHPGALERLRGRRRAQAATFWRWAYGSSPSIARAIAQLWFQRSAGRRSGVSSAEQLAVGVHAPVEAHVGAAALARVERPDAGAAQVAVGLDLDPVRALEAHGGRASRAGGTAGGP